MRILVADDDKDIASGYRDALEYKGHQVTLTYSGQECIDIYKTNPNIDLVILDYKMPNLTGIDTAKEITKLNPDQKILFISAYVMDSLWQKMVEFGKNVHILQKPITIKILTDMVDEYKS